MERCPVKRFSEALIESGAIAQSDYVEMIQRIDRTLDEAMAFAKASPFPNPRDLLADVYR